MTNEEIKAYKGNPAGTIFGLMEHIRPKECKMVNGGNRMTNKEAIEQFKERLAVTDYRKDIPEYYEAMETAIEALELCEWRNCESDCKTCRSRCRAWQNGYNAKQEKMLTIIKR